MRKPTQPRVKARYPWTLLRITPAQVLILSVECEEIPRAFYIWRTQYRAHVLRRQSVLRVGAKLPKRSAIGLARQIRLRHGNIAATSGERRRRDGLEL